VEIYLLLRRWGRGIRSVDLDPEFGPNFECRKFKLGQIGTKTVQKLLLQPYIYTISSMLEFSLKNLFCRKSA
jgi:hypothetical protein